MWKEVYLKQPGATQVNIPLNLEDISVIADTDERRKAERNRRLFIGKADEAKIALSTKESVDVELEIVAPIMQRITVSISRETLAELIRRDIQILVNTFKAMIEAEPDRKVDVIVVSGNSSRIPLVLELLRETFPGIAIDPQPEPGKVERFLPTARLKESIVSGLLEYSLIGRVTIPTAVIERYPQMPRKLIVWLGTTTRKSEKDFFAKILDKRADLPTGWTPIQSASLNRNTIIKILAMGGSGEEQSLTIGDNGDRRNPRIQPLGTINCGNLGMPDSQLRKCEVEVKVELNRSVSVRITKEGEDVHSETLHPAVILD